MSCNLSETESSEVSVLPPCECPRDEHDIVIHEESCLMFKHETIIYPHEPHTCECTSPRFVSGVCECCACLPDLCLCKRAGKGAVEEWREQRNLTVSMPAVLEATHPLMQKFQENLRRFLEKENAQAETEIKELKDDLRLTKLQYDKELEGVYKSDHDTNDQRALIEEYEVTLTKKTQDRLAAEQRAREANERYKKSQNKFETDTTREREALDELEALSNLCRQLEKWHEETESGLTISYRMSDKMKLEKRTLADEKRQLDMIVLGLDNEVWKLESKLEMFQKQMDVKNKEMAIVNDRVTAYATELEDLDLDKRRLMALWNSVVVNIKQRDKVFDSVRDDYNNLQENYRTLLSNLEVTKKITMDEMNQSKLLAMNTDKLNYDINAASKVFDAEDAKRINLETHLNELSEAIEMTERDLEMIKMENQAMANILNSTKKDLERRRNQRFSLTTELLKNHQISILNDKAVDTMIANVKKMRDMSTKLEISLMQMENQHAKIMLEIEVYRSRQQKNNEILEKSQQKVRDREKEIDTLQDKHETRILEMTRKQRELDLVLKKYNALKEIFDMKSPQERRIEDLEKQIKCLRDRTDTMQHEWLRLQGHVVKLSEQHQKTVSDINLLNKQIQICDQKTMRVQADIEKVNQDRLKVERSLRDLRTNLQVLERSRKEASERNSDVEKFNQTITHEYIANLKDAESEIMDLEEEIERLDGEKIALTKELDKVQREALVWQRKGILAVELKRNIKDAKSAVGEIGQMKTEIHRMEVRREQLRRTGEKLADDLAQYVTRRETALEKTRATAAVEEAHGASAGHTSQSMFHHKLRLAKADVTRVSKELSETTNRLGDLNKEHERLRIEIDEKKAAIADLEEQVATLLKEARQADRTKQWMLEKVVRSQRLGTELATAVRRQSLKVRKSKSTIFEEYELARKLNDRIRLITENLVKDYPYLDERFETIMNTLNIFDDEAPKLCEEAGPCCEVGDECDSNVAEKPLQP